MRTLCNRPWTASLLVGVMLLAGCVVAPEEGSESASCGLYADRDGDGFGRTDRSECAHLTENERTFPASSTEDCDDADPTRHVGVQFYTDRDGDGFGEPNIASVWGCQNDVIEGFAPNARDCAPTDPTLQIERSLDRDGDGDGSTARECAGVDDPRYADTSGDCDDTDPSVSSLAEESPFDGVDSNCDGADIPRLSCSDPDALELPSYAPCDGVGLAVVAFGTCFDGCGGSSWVLVTNVGSETSASSTIEVLYDGAPYENLQVPPLAPGERSPLSVPVSDEIELELVMPEGAMSCAPAGNVRFGFPPAPAPKSGGRGTLCSK